MVTYPNQSIERGLSCQIPECDSLEPNVKFKPDWIARAVPMEANGKPSQCLRYVPDTKLRTDDLTCPGVSFNRSQTEQCGDFVYATDEVTLVNEVCMPNGRVITTILYKTAFNAELSKSQIVQYHVPGERVAPVDYRISRLCGRYCNGVTVRISLRSVMHNSSILCIKYIILHSSSRHTTVLVGAR